MGPDPAVAAIRIGVRRALVGLDRGALVLAACSGGSDSLAMAAALAFEAPKLGLRPGAVTVDHGLQPGSAAQADRVAGTLQKLGLEPVRVLRADVLARGDAAGYPGPEAAARHARYAAIEAAADECGAAAVLLGHTMDDQAETVLLGLARGSGARSLAGMAAVAGNYVRPLLGTRRIQTRAACAALGLDPWDDPQNSDESYARVRVRQQVLPLMEELLGPGITEALARTADSLRADADALDAVADEAAERLMPGWPPVPVAAGGSGGASARAGRAAGGSGGSSPRASKELTLEVAALAALPAAIRTRLLRRAAVAAGAPAGSLSSVHVRSMDELLTGWHGQRWSDLPGGVRCLRRYGRLQFTTRS